MIAWIKRAWESLGFWWVTGVSDREFRQAIDRRVDAAFARINWRPYCEFGGASPERVHRICQEMSLIWLAQAAAERTPEDLASALRDVGCHLSAGETMPDSIRLAWEARQWTDRDKLEATA